jgi:hypothetical protein
MFTAAIIRQNIKDERAEADMFSAELLKSSPADQRDNTGLQVLV